MPFKTVTKTNPCPICGKGDQCSKTEDGGVCCFRPTGPQSGYRIQKSKGAKDGREFTIYQPINNGSWQKPTKQPETNDLWAAIYEYILTKFPCDAEEKQELSRRGSKGFGNYGSMPFSNSSTRREVAQELLEKFGEDIFKCPGISKNCPSGKGTLPWIEGPEGLMIPVKDWKGKIQGIIIRPRLQDGGSKYLWMTSSNKGGASATPRLHIPTRTPQLLKHTVKVDGLWITEGALKANVLSEIHDIACVGTPSNNLEPANAFIESQPMQKIVLAYDQDSNPVARKVTSKNLLKVYDKFQDHDFWLAVWDGATAKGIDDLLQAGGTYQLLPKHEALEYLKAHIGTEQTEITDYNYNPDGMLKTEWTEAIELVGAFGSDMKFMSEWEDFLMWNGSTWKTDKYGPGILYKKFLDRRMQMMSDREADDPALKWLIGGHKMSRMNAVMAHLKTEVAIRKRVSEIPVVRNVITCPNGTVDLTTGDIRKHSRDDWQMAACPTVYDPEATCPRWLQLLDDVFLGSADLINYVQKLFGMAITGAPNDHVFPVFCGDGRNGKSTVLGTIQKVLGDDLASTVASDYLCKGNESHPTWLASFHGKRLMVANETARGMELNVALVKLLTGGDMITCRKLFQNEWSFNPTHTFILCTNEKPAIHESNIAIWARIALVPFKASFSEANGNLDTDLPTRILSESKGILAWLVQGALKYRSEGLTKPEEIKKQNAEYREDSDPEESVTSWLTQFSSPADNAWMKSSILYQHYFNWCLEGGIKALGIKGFSISLSKDDKGFERRLYAGYKEFRRKVTPVKSVKIGKDDNSF